MRDVITFQRESVAELNKAFRESIDDYLAFCKQRGETPDKPFSGQFVTRISPELHRQVNVPATLAGKSLNAFVSEQLQSEVRNGYASKVSHKKVTQKVKKPTVTKTSTKKKGIKSQS